MAEEVKSSPASGGLFALIRAPREFYGGLALIVLALLALWAASDLPGMRGFSFGPGTAPRLYAWLLIGVGAIIMLTGLLTDGPPIEKFAVRGPLFVVLAIIMFALTIRGYRFHFFGSEVRIPELGLIVATYCSFMLAVIGGRQIRWIEALIAAAAMTAFCVVLFRYLLQLPFPLWPNF
jgi:putative tricarboxylic transport membrane protein